MSYLKEKSNFNLEAAELLIEKSCYAPSVHCSYYSCFQFIKSRLNKIGITYEKMDSDIASNPILKSNKYPIDLAVNKIREKNVLSSRELKDKIKLLKTLRTESDYHNIQINYTKSNEAFQLSKSIISIIRTNLT